MTDKQIIIDGVDVSGCEFYNKDDKTCREVNGKYDTDICEFDKCENSNCNYKQLKRKEQEYEELKGRLKYIINENKVLKDCATDEDIDIVALKNYISTLEFSNDQLKDVIKKYEECNKFLVEENGKTYTRLEYKLLRILTEIKEIAENVQSFVGRIALADPVFQQMEQILQKINECEI